MHMKTIGLLLLMLAALLTVMPNDAGAIPAFARKHGFNCNMCHTAFTELNDFGQRIRDDGYQMPGQEGREMNVFQTAPPISLRTSAGLLASHSTKGDASTFALNGLDLLAAGVLHKNISFLLIYTPRLDEPAADYSGTEAGQPGALESANIIFSNLVCDALNVRVGRFEPGYHPFSSKRSYYLRQGYEIYGFTTPGNEFVFDDNQVGVEASGHFRNGFKYTAGVVNGSGANPDINNAKDVYVNLFQTIGRGDGQSAGQRLGAFAYYGWQPTGEYVHFVGDGGQADGKGNVGFYRVGGDLNLNWRTFNLKTFFMYGRDDEKLNSIDSSAYIFRGGFARLDWAGLWNNRLIVSGMYNWVRPPCYDKDQPPVDVTSALLRYYLGDWTAVNIALHLEYSYRDVGGENGESGHSLAALIDFDF
jgi:hypothetical protein